VARAFDQVILGLLEALRLPAPAFEDRPFLFRDILIGRRSADLPGLARGRGCLVANSLVVSVPLLLHSGLLSFPSAGAYPASDVANGASSGIWRGGFAV
jgi:hypothetical protein